MIVSILFETPFPVPDPQGELRRLKPYFCLEENPEEQLRLSAVFPFCFNLFLQYKSLAIDRNNPLLRRSEPTRYNSQHIACEMYQLTKSNHWSLTR